MEAPEEPGRLRFTPSDALNEGAGDLTRDKKRRGRQQARHDTGTGAAPEGGGGRLRFTKEEQRQAGDGGTTGPEPSGAADGDTGDGTGEAGSDTGDPRQARKTGYSKKFLAAHETEILLHKAAKAAFDKLCLQKLPTYKTLQAEYAGLLAEKKKAYAEYAAAKKEMQAVLTAKANVDRLLGAPPERPEQEKEQAQR